jgi:demethylmenaquinone methyltransferase/2-methoxy-6-polyprenyl-1,4-benzoquinol methylase
MRVLDVCTGTGDLALLCTSPPQPPEAVIGVDMNRAMLGAAARKGRGGGIGWVEADALALPFGDGVFDRVLIGFSTRNLADLTEGLREMVRVLRPGGQLLILETGRPANPLVRAGYFVFLSSVGRSLGWLLTGRCWPFAYLARSVRQFLRPPEVLERLRTVRTQPEYVPLSGGLASLFVATKLA